MPVFDSIGNYRRIVACTAFRDAPFMSWKSVGTAVAIVLVVLLVIALMRRSRFGDPVERLAGMFVPSAPPPGNDPTGAAT